MHIIAQFNRGPPTSIGGRGVRSRSGAGDRVQDRLGLEHARAKQPSACKNAFL